MKKYERIGNEDPISTFCRMAINTTYDDIPDYVLKYSKYSILDTIGVMIGGSAMEGIREVVDFVKGKGGKPESNIVLFGGKVPAAEAAMAMGPMSRSMDFAQIHPEALHCTEYTVPVLLAALGLKENVSGKEFLTAFTLGQEIGIRTGMGFKPTRGIPLGISTGHYIFGCVATVGKLIGLNQNDFENAEGIGREMTQPHDTAMMHPVTLMLKVHQGFICQDAITCCELAKRGITGPRSEVLTGPRGYLSFPKWQTEPDALLKNLGTRWELMDAEFKPYIGGKCAHAPIFGIIDQMGNNKFALADIEHITVDLPPVGWQLLCAGKSGSEDKWIEPAAGLKDFDSFSPCESMSAPSESMGASHENLGDRRAIEDKWNPKSAYDCQFSLPFLIATAAIDNDVFLSSFAEDTRNRTNVRNLMKIVSATEDTSLPAWSGRVTTTLKDGRKLSRIYLFEELKGTSRNQYTEEELVAKFKKSVPFSVYKLSDSVIDSVIDTILNLEKSQDIVKDLVLPLTPH
jgi:2-methylcitrate dehydratase PrpD